MDGISTTLLSSSGPNPLPAPNDEVELVLNVWIDSFRLWRSSFCLDFFRASRAARLNIRRALRWRLRVARILCASMAAAATQEPSQKHADAMLSRHPAPTLHRFVSHT